MRRSARVAIVVSSMIVAAIVLRAALPASQTGKWQAVGSLASANSGSAAVLLQDGSVLISGGAGANGTSAAAQIFGSDGSIASAGNMNEPRSQHTAVVLSDGRVLVTGGSTAAGPTNSAEIYDPASRTWSLTASTMTSARSGHTATLLSDGRVLMAGGSTSSGPTNTLEIFDPSTGQFASAGVSMSSPRANHAAAVLSDGRVLLIGGNNGANALTSVDSFDPAAGTIVPAAPLSTPRNKATATTLLNGNVAVIGGNNGQADQASAEIYNAASGSWSVIAGGVPRSGHIALLLKDNYSVLVFGGSNAQDTSADLFTQNAGTGAASFVSTGASLTSHAGGIGSGMGAPGMVLGAGGSVGAGAEVYSFPTVKTDAADYPPGTTVNISGSGFQPNEPVTITLIESPLLDTHGPYTVTADAFGNISDSSFTTDIHDLNIRFYMIAQGQTSGFAAQNTFTDANANTTTSVTASANPVAVGTSVTFTATIARVGTGGDPSCGSVVFDFGDGSAVSAAQSVSSGHTATSPSHIYSTTGTFTVTATYTPSGNGCNFNGGNGSLAESIELASNTTVTSSPNPSNVGQSVTFTATVSGGSGNNRPTPGTVTFKDGAATLGSTSTFTNDGPGAINATFATSSLASGSHSITAVYSGDAQFASSTSAPYTQTVNSCTAAAVTTQPTSQTVTYNANASFSAAASGTPTPTVQWQVSTDNGATWTNVSGATSTTLSLTSPPVSSSGNKYRAVFTNTCNGTQTANSNAATLTVNAASTTTAVSAPTITYGADGSIGVTVSSAAGTPTGNATLSVDGGAAQTAALDGTGKATFTVTKPSAGDHTLSASYAAQGNFAASGPTSGTLHVNPAVTSTAVSAPNVTYGTDGSVTVTVSSSSPGAGTPTGNATLSVDGGTAQTAALDGTGKATFTVTKPNAGDHTLSASYAAQGNFAASGPTSGTLHVDPKTLTASIIGDPTKPYDGNTNATLTSANFSLTGLVGTESFTVTKTAGTYNFKDVTTATTVTASLAAGDFTAGTGTLASNYTLPTTASGPGHITAITLTAAIQGDPTKPYDGNTNATLTAANFKLTGLIGTESISVTKTSGTYNSKDVLAAATVTASLGSGDFSAGSGTLTSNYNLPTTASGPGHITAVTLTAAIVGPPTKPYDGNTDATLAPANFHLTGLVGTETFSVGKATGTYNSKDVTAATTVSTSLAASDFTPANGALASNYVLPTTASGPGTITAKTLTASITGDPTKPYNGNTNATLTSANFSLTGLVGTESFTVTKTTGTYNFKDVTTATTVTASLAAGDFTAGTGTLASNYTLPTTASGPGHITAVSVTIAILANDKSYDSTTTATLKASGGCSATGIIAADVATVTPSCTGAHFDTPNAGSGKTVTANISLSGNTFGDYTLGTATTATTTASIQTAPVTATLHAQDKVYDGNTTEPDAKMSCTVAPLFGTDSVTCSPSAGTFNSKDVATANQVTATVAISGNSNYTLGAAGTSTSSLGGVTATAHITAAPVGASIIGTPTKPYDGNDTATLTSANFSLSGLVGSESFTVTKTSGTYDSKHVNATTVTASLASADFTPVSGAVASNYTLPTTASGPGHITAKTVTASVTASSKTYDGTANASITNCSLTGVIAPDTTGCAASASAADNQFADKNVGTGKLVTANNISLTNNGSGDYTLNSVTSATTHADITTAAVTPTLTALDKVYDGSTTEPNGNMSCTVAPLFAGDTAPCSATGGTFNSKDVATANQVTATVAISGGASANYTLGAAGTSISSLGGVTATAHITPATLTVNASAADTTYTGLAYAGATACSATGVNGETPAATSQFLDSGNNVVTPIHAGSYSLKCSAGGTGTNYSANSKAVPFAINPATPSIHVSAASTTYTGLDYAGVNTCSATGVNGETPAATPQFLDSGNNVVTPRHAGSYSLKCSAGGTGTDYVATSGTAPFTIGQATLSINVTAGSTIYTGLTYAGANTCSATGVNGETPAATPQFLDSNSAAISAPVHSGSYSLQCSAGGTGTDYVADSHKAPFAIAQAPLTIHVSAAGTTYTGLPYAGANTCTADGVNSEHPITTAQYQDATYNNIPTPTNAGSYFLKCSAGGPATDYVAGSDKAGFAIAKANVNVVFSNVGPFTYNTSPQAPTFAVNGVNSEVLTSSATASYSGSQLDATPYTSTSAPSNAGNYTQTVAFGGNGNYNALTPSATQNFAINKADQATLTVTGPNSVTYGTTGTATASGGSGTGALSFAATGSTGCSLSSTTVSVVDVGGTCSLTASKAGDNNYNSATSVAFPVTLVKANAVILVTGYSGTYDGHAHGATGSAAGVEPTPANLSGLLHLGASFTNVPGGAAYWTFDGNNNYNNSSGSVAIAIAKANATIVVTPYSVTYDGSPHTAAGSATGVLGESLAGLNLTPTTHTGAGTYINDGWAFTDSTGNYNNASGTVNDQIAKNVPTVTITVPTSTSNMTPIGQNFAVKASFSGGAPTDTYSAVFTFDDGAGHVLTANGTASGPGASGTITSAINFALTGIYKTSVVVTGSSAANSQGSQNQFSDVQLPAFIVAYDPTGSFVTGGGWINSIAGALTSNSSFLCGSQCATLAGKATFGFESKYQKGATTPSGNTQFNFQMGNVDFHSIDYQWLTVSGPMAQFKGRGTINGKNDPNTGQPFNFLLTARDGSAKGGGGTDGFRIQITDSTGTVVYYDNMLGATDTSLTNANVEALGSTSGGGSVVIH